MSFTKKFLTGMLLTMVFAVSGTNSFALAQSSTTAPTVLPSSGDLADKIKQGNMHFDDIPKYIGQVIKFFLMIAGALAVVMIIYGGFKYAVSGVSPDQRSAGKTAVVHAIAGLVVALMAWFLVDVFINLITS